MKRMTVVIIAEKPDAASHIASALAEKGLKKLTSTHGVDYYEFMRNNKKHIVVCAVGHLFNLKQKSKGWEYPIYDVEWVPSYQARKLAMFSKKYFDTITEVAQNGTDYIIACDYDNEGSVIGFNVLRFICHKEDAKRMKFSTLTKVDLIKSYEEMNKHMDFQNVECGIARHTLDFYYGINTSRALTLSIKKSSPRFMLLSAGRVQGPVLCLLAEKEAEIEKFKPVPFWSIEGILKIAGKEVDTEFEEDKVWDEKKAKKVYDESKGKDAVVDEVTKKTYKQTPPVPFNITSLQTEAYRLFGYSPQYTMSLAQKLYTSAYISYPRTSSEKLPPQINYGEIIKALSKLKKYDKICKQLLALQKLVPVEGKRTDAAHEAIHPTNEPPSRELTGPAGKVYDLICRRFFSHFSTDAVRESMVVKLNIGKNKFTTTGRRTLEKGWTLFYGPYAKSEEIILPDLKKGDKISVKKLDLLSKETQPPGRYSQASIIKEMEKRNLGTRATRSAILQTLYDRKYVMDKSVKVTELGMAIAKTLKKYVPDLIDEQLTKQFEIELDEITTGKVKKEKIFNDAKKVINKISEEFKKNEEKIGKDLGKAVVKTQEESNNIGICPNCGGDLKKLFSIFTKKSFCGCNNYNKCKICGFSKKACKCKCPICGDLKGKCKDAWKDKVWNPSCQTGYPLPGNANIVKTDKICEHCKTPIVYVYRQGKRPFKMCLDPKCKTKADWNKPKEVKKAVKKKATKK